MLNWNLYEITSGNESIHGVMLRGRIRKFALQNDLVCLAENATDKENVVRFSLLEREDPATIKMFIKSIFPEADIKNIDGVFQNPVLSKLKVNDESRYTI